MSQDVQIKLSLNGAQTVINQFRSLQGVVANFGSILAGAGIASTLRDAWKAAEEARVAEFQLVAALKAAGEASESNVRAFVDQAGSLQALTGVADETVEAVQRVLLSMGATAEQTHQLTPMVLDVAAAMGTDATTAARQLGASLDGQSVSLGRLNIKAESFEDLMGQLNSRFRGQAAALMEAKGPMASLSTSLGELQESLGNLAAWYATPFIQQLSKIADALVGITSSTPPGASSAFWDFFKLGGGGSFGVLPLIAEGMQAAKNWMNPPTPAGKIVSLRQGGGGSASGPDEEAESITAEMKRREEFARDILQTKAKITNEFDVRRRLISQDTSIDESTMRRDTLAVLREELPVVQRLADLKAEEYERQLRVDPEKNLETTLAAEKQLNDVLVRRSEIMAQMRTPPPGSMIAGTQSAFNQFQTASAFDADQGLGRAGLAGIQETMMQLGGTAQNVAGVISSTLGTAFQTIGNQITGLIMGTKTWGQALQAAGTIILTTLVGAIVQFFVNLAAQSLLNAIFGTALQTAAAASASAAWAGPAILASIATYGSAAAIAPAAVSTALASAPAIGALGSVAGYAVGGLTPGRPTLAMVGEQGPEMVINAKATRRNLAALQAVNAGADIGAAMGGSGGSPGRPVNVNVYFDRAEWLRANQDDIEAIAHDAFRRTARA